MIKEKFANYIATVEERSDGIFVSTLWDKEYCLNVDRCVKEFETQSAAIAHMYKTLFNLAKEMK